MNTSPAPAGAVRTQADPLIEGQIDPRGPRFSASVTSVVLAAVLLAAPHPAGTALLALQALLFAAGATLGVRRTPTGLAFQHLVRPRLSAPSHLEDAAPPRFAQAVGLVFALVGLAGYLSGATLMGAIATGFALAAALLNAVFGFCLGCELYLLVRRIAPIRRDAVVPDPSNKKEAHA